MTYLTVLAIAAGSLAQSTPAFPVVDLVSCVAFMIRRLIVAGLCPTRANDREANGGSEYLVRYVLQHSICAASDRRPSISRAPDPSTPK